MPQTTNMIRWRTHVYTLGHSLSYFQADFAGRLANRITQVGPAIREIAVDDPRHASLRRDLRASRRSGCSAAISLWLALPMALWIGGLRRAAALFRAAGAGALARERRGALGHGRAHRRQLHQHPDRQAFRPRRGGALGGARGARDLDALLPRTPSASSPASTAMLSVMNSLLLSLDRRALRSGCGRAGDMTSGRGGGRARARHAHPRHVRLGDADRARRVRERRRGPGEHGDDRPAARPSSMRRARSRSRSTTGEVRFENVTFHYGRDEGVIEDLSFAIRAGREGRARRRERRRQVDHRLAAPAPARPRGRAHPHRRPGHRRASRRIPCGARSPW